MYRTVVIDGSIWRPKYILPWYAWLALLD